MKRYEITNGNQEASKAMVKRINEVAVRYAKDNARPYALSMSVGVTVFRPDQFIALESLLDQADAEMYEIKNSRKASAR